MISKILNRKISKVGRLASANNIYVYMGKQTLILLKTSFTLKRCIDY
jgi:hypothetical protein